MAEERHTREHVQGQLAAARAALAELAAGRAEGELAALRPTPEWSGVDLLRHMLAWDELGLRAVDAWGEGGWAPAFDDEDAFNAEQVALRAGLGAAELVARLEAAHGRMAAALELPDERLEAVGLAPWHERVTLLRAVSGLAWHDGMHLGVLRDAIGRAAD